MIAHCLFEQSGTFKNEFKKLGYEAYDYDILNDYGETDYQIDLFKEIEGGYNNQQSIFDSMTTDDVIMAFFPCTMFQENNVLLFNGKAFQFKNSSDITKLQYCISRHETLHEFYTLLCKMCVIAIQKGLRLVIENPATQPHYLNMYFPLQPKVIDNNRNEHGDYFKKPTQYWFINFEPQNNFIFEPMSIRSKKVVNRVKGADRQRQRSEIAPEYANWFIRSEILEDETN